MRKIIAAALAVLMLCAALGGCSAGGSGGSEHLGNGWEPTSTMELQYAENFSVEYYDGGYKLITMSTGEKYVVVPEGAGLPEGMDSSIVPLYQPIGNIYLVSTPTMCLFDSLDSLDAISFSGTKADGWYNDDAKAAMENGSILFAGKYSEPDYELLISSGCGLAIENTMIDHTPDVREKLEELGIPVMTELSSLESHPLGRTEWIKLFGAMLNKEELAAQLFDEQAAYVDSLSTSESTGKTVAFFYINSSGNAVVRKSGDYVSKMIELAGGVYIFSDLGDKEKATSTVNMEMEQFYAAAKDADYIIYNSTIDGGVSSISELVAKNSLLADFKAVKDGNVWCTDKNLFQETMQFGQMIKDMNTMLTTDDPTLTQLEYLYKLS